MPVTGRRAPELALIIAGTSPTARAELAAGSSLQLRGFDPHRGLRWKEPI